MCAALIVASLGTARAQPAPAAVDGEALFERMRATWSALPAPSLLEYDIVVASASGSRARRDRYHGEVEPASGDFRVRPFSEAEERQPYVPRGTNVSWGIHISTGGAPLSGGGGSGFTVGGWITHEAPVEPFAIPELSPLYAFGLRTCASAAAPAAAAEALPTIGRVATVQRRYRITVIGPERVDDRPALHLALVPLIDARRDRVRDLWIDPQTAMPLAARVAGNFTGRAESAVPWLIRFSSVDGTIAIDTEIAEGPVQRGRTRFDHVVVRFERLTASHASRSLAFAIPPDAADLNAIEEPPERGGDCVAEQRRR